MSAAKFQDGRMTQLDGKAAPDEVVTPDDVKDAEKLARRLQKAYADLAELKRRWNPRFVYHWDRAVDGSGTTQYRFEHGFGGRVNWTICRWKSTAGGGQYPSIEEHANTDSAALVLISGVAGTVTIRVEEAV